MDGFTQSKGIVGGHNSNAFYGKLEEVGGKEISETAHPTISGIKEVRYEIPKKGKDGNPLVPPEYKVVKTSKTIYDPKIISDKQMAQWGQEAMKMVKLVVLMGNI